MRGGKGKKAPVKPAAKPAPKAAKSGEETKSADYSALYKLYAIDDGVIGS